MKTLKIFLKTAVLTGLLLMSSATYALEQMTGHVTVLEPSYLPGSIAFMLDAGSVSCPAGRWFWWSSSDVSMNKAVYATLMTALITNKKVNFFVNDGDTTCKGQHLHILKD